MNQTSTNPKNSAFALVTSAATRRLVVCFMTVTVLSLPAATVSANAVKPNYEKVNNSRWRCRSCPFELGTQSQSRIAASLIDTGDVDTRFGRDNGLTEDGGHFNLDATYLSRDEETGRLFTFDGRNLGLDSRRLDLSLAHPARYRVRLSWAEIPRNEWDNALTATTGESRRQFPANWTRANSTTGMTQLVSASRPTRIGTSRERQHAALLWYLGERWQLESSYTRETRTGRQVGSGDFLLQSTALPTPIDHQTDTATAAVRYLAPRWLVDLHVRRSEFDNGNTSLVWQNPYTLFGSNEEGQKGLAPDNKSTSWGFTTRFNPTDRHVINASAEWAENTQNQAFLPPSVNPAVPPPPVALPPGLDGKVETFAARLAWVMRVGSRGSLKLGWLSRERDNRTRPIQLTPVLGDLVPSLARLTRHYSFEREQASAEFSLRLHRRAQLAIGTATETRSRTLLEIESNDEDRNWAALRLTLPGSGRLNLRYTDARRDASDFQSISRNNPLTRRFYMAAREQEKWAITANLPLSDELSLGLSADRRANRYPDSVLGLRDDEDRSRGGDLTWHISNRADLNVHRSIQETRSLTAGSSSFANPDWFSNTSDEVRTTGVNLALTQVFGRGEISVAWDHSDGVGAYDTVFNSVASVFPELVSEHKSLDVTARWPLSPRNRLLLRYYRENYRSADWQLDGVGVDTLATVISFGLISPNYKAHLVSLTFESQL